MRRCAIPAHAKTALTKPSQPAEASPSGPCLSLFGPILTHPSSTTFPWSPLRHALNNYFGGAPLALDPNKIHSGWCGLSLILTAFRRLEVVDSELETAELLSWLQALKVAAVRRRCVLSCPCFSFGGVGS